jgi:hypothetical protein
MMSQVQILPPRPVIKRGCGSSAAPFSRLYPAGDNLKNLITVLFYFVGVVMLPAVIPTPSVNSRSAFLAEIEKGVMRRLFSESKFKISLPAQLIFICSFSPRAAG